MAWRRPLADHHLVGVHLHYPHPRQIGLAEQRDAEPLDHRATHLRHLLAVKLDRVEPDRLAADRAARALADDLEGAGRQVRADAPGIAL